MHWIPLGVNAVRVNTAPPIWHATVDAPQWRAVAQQIADQGGRLVALWAGGDHGPIGKPLNACAAYAGQGGLLCVALPLAADLVLASLADLFPCASRMQRAMTDLYGTQTSNHGSSTSDDRPWLDHGLWRSATPLRHAASPPCEDALEVWPQDYAFVPVQGDGVHEIAVGPVHAGIIEPGHFRFSVVGEKVLRLEERLGYTHKGIEQRFTELAPLDAYALAGRISGDTTVAYAWAYCMALESAWHSAVPERALWLRALLLERERVANHLGDLGALGNDAALGFGLAQFSRLREDWQRLSGAVFGHRLMMDAVVPGGVAIDVSADQTAQLLAQFATVEREVRTLKTIYDEHAGLQDRFMTTGCVEPELARQLGLTGLAGRASGQAHDLRCDHPCLTYAALGVNVALRTQGDVAARVAVRFDEIFEALRLMRLICARLPPGDTRVTPHPRHHPSLGWGWIEGWRGEVLVALELGADTRIQRCHAHDPSWQNWPALEHAVIGNIVPDFPLINKSFNLSYSGHDL